MNNHAKLPGNNTGLFTLAIRLVVGWTYFSAFWRRVILADKLNPEGAGYIGEKFNHFLPNALGIKPIIEHLVTHPEQLWMSMVIFTIIEAIVGLFIMLGLVTRLMSIGIFGLAAGILLGSGWIGTTCLDEWQIGVLGIATGFTLFFCGSGTYSLDRLLVKKKLKFTQSKWFVWLGSGELPLKNIKPLVLGGSLVILLLTLYTNQVFHGGVFGSLHNKSVKPKLEISNATLKNNQLQFNVYRTEGADVYGSFLIGIQLIDTDGRIVMEKTAGDLAGFPASEIQNYYVAEIKPGPHSLIVPLGAKADLSINLSEFSLARGRYTLKLIDISGLEWKSNVEL